MPMVPKPAGLPTAPQGQPSPTDLMMAAATIYEQRQAEMLIQEPQMKAQADAPPQE